jgi:molecular chaperone GrpE
VSDKGNGGEKDDPKDAGAEESGLAPVNGTPVAPPTPEEVAALRQEIDQLKDQLLRRRADFENFRRRVERDRTQAGVDAVTTLVQALIPGLDSLDRALSAGGSEASLREGVELTRREVMAVLEAQGLTADEPLGRRFDPEVHQALAHEEVEGTDDGIIVEVFRKAYFLKGRLVRPALVKVAKGKGAAQEAPVGGGEPGAVH